MSVCDVDGCAFVVTGGAGHLGRTICTALAVEGAHVLCLSSRPVDFASGDIVSAVCDVGDESQVAGLIGSFADHHGQLDGLVNGAVRAPRGIDLNMPRSEFDAGLGSILTHYFTCARIAAPLMTAGGSIVNLTSMWGLLAPQPKLYLDLGNEPSAVMAAGAGGILGLTRYLAQMLAPQNIRVNALVPGFFPKARGPERPEYMAEITSRVPLGRIGTPEDMIGPVLFLLSGASDYMTGQQMVVDGGYGIQ